MQVLELGRDAGGKLHELGLRRKPTWLLRNWHVHQAFNQTVLLQKLAKGDQQAMLGIGRWPVRSGCRHGLILRAGGYPPVTRPCKISSESTIRALVAQNLR